MSKRRKSALAQKIRSGKKVVLYELLPLPTFVSAADLKNLSPTLINLFSAFPIDAINLPEVRNENRNGRRETCLIAKTEPRILASCLQRLGDWEIIINKPIVYLPWEKQKRWLNETYHKYHIKNFIFVGGESRKIKYPGLPVTEAVKLVKTTLRDKFPEIFLGGITIPSRKNEPARLVSKTISGMEYFTSQVIFESVNVKKLLLGYQRLCQKNNLSPKMIFLTFAPIGCKKDLELMDWLGVNVPPETKKRITAGWLGLGLRSIEVCSEILQDILQFIKKENIRVPVGLNIGHITRSNFELSFMLVDRLSKIYPR